MAVARDCRTVPPAHVGFEFDGARGPAERSHSVRSRLSGGCLSELATVPQPDAGVDPVHLRALMDPMCICVNRSRVSATAPLSQTWAGGRAAFCDPAVGNLWIDRDRQIASRRTARDVEWQLFEGRLLSKRKNWAEGVTSSSRPCALLEVTSTDRSVAWAAV